MEAKARNRYVYTLKFTYTDIVTNKPDIETNSIVDKITKKGGKVINYNHIVMGGSVAIPMHLLTFIHYEADGPIIL